MPDEADKVELLLEYGTTLCRQLLRQAVRAARARKAVGGASGSRGSVSSAGSSDGGGSCGRDGSGGSVGEGDGGRARAGGGEEEEDDDDDADDDDEDEGEDGDGEEQVEDEDDDDDGDVRTAGGQTRAPSAPSSATARRPAACTARLDLPALRVYRKRLSRYTARLQTSIELAKAEGAGTSFEADSYKAFRDAGVLELAIEMAELQRFQALVSK